MRSPVPPSERFGRQNAEREQQRRDVDDALRIDGSQFIRLYEKMQALIANLQTTVTNLVTSLTYTRAQVDARIASPGNISPGNVSASGSVTAGGEVAASGKVRGGNIWGNILSVDYRVVYVSNPSGELGHVPSSRRFKLAIEPAALDTRALLGLELKRFKYKKAVEAYGSEEAAPLELGLIAEEVQAAGLDYLVYLGENGEPDGVAYERLGLPLLAIAQSQQAEIDGLRAEVRALRDQLQ
jgi:hypothetical protein